MQIFSEEARIKREKTRELKKFLSSTDYKIIKYYEYICAGLDAPYDISTLHSNREALREQIRVLSER